MNRNASFALVFAAAVGTATPVFGRAAPPATAPEQTKPTDPMSEIVCQKQEVVGSRLATRRVCMTRLQWQEQRSGDREQTEKAQTPAARSSPGG